MRTRLFRPLAALILLGCALAACSDDDGATEPSSDTPANDATPSPDGEHDTDGDDEAWPPADAAGTGQAGEVTIDGVTYGIDATRACDLTDVQGGTRDTQVEGIGVIDPDDDFADPVVITVFTGTADRDRSRQGVEWNGPEGLFEGSAIGNDDNWMVVSDRLDGPPLEIGDRVNGELPLQSALGRDPVTASVDIEHPTGAAVPCD